MPVMRPLRPLRPGRAVAAVPRAILAALLLAAVLLAAGGARAAALFETKAEHAILIDYETGTVLFQKGADQPTRPASLAKLMTVAVVFEALRDGRLTMEQTFRVSRNAWQAGGSESGGSTMFAEVGKEIAISDLLRGMIVQSGNDACIVVAEGMAGSEAAFARLMNAEAKRIGLRATTFRNATGLPDPDQVTTVRDLAVLSAYLIREFPEYYPIFAEPSFTWSGITQRNRNPLLTMNIGADGLKTGYIEEAGYGLAGSAVRNGRRLIVVINGTKSETERAEEGRKLLEWGFLTFNRVSLFGDGEVIAEARVFGGAAPTVGLRSRQAISVLLPAGHGDEVAARVIYDGPVPAPVREGQEIGVFAISIAGEETSRTPLYAAADVPLGSLPRRAGDALMELLTGWW